MALRLFTEKTNLVNAHHEILSTVQIDFIIQLAKNVFKKWVKFVQHRKKLRRLVLRFQGNNQKISQQLRAMFSKWTAFTKVAHIYLLGKFKSCTVHWISRRRTQALTHVFNRMRSQSTKIQKSRQRMKFINQLVNQHLYASESNTIRSSWNRWKTFLQSRHAMQQVIQRYTLKCIHLSSAKAMLQWKACVKWKSMCQQACVKLQRWHCGAQVSHAISIWQRATRIARLCDTIQFRLTNAKLKKHFVAWSSYTTKVRSSLKFIVIWMQHQVQRLQSHQLQRCWRRWWEQLHGGSLAVLQKENELEIERLTLNHNNSKNYQIAQYNALTNEHKETKAQHLVMLTQLDRDMNTKHQAIIKAMAVEIDRKEKCQLEEIMLLETSNTTAMEKANQTHALTLSKLKMSWQETALAAEKELKSKHQAVLTDKLAQLTIALQHKHAKELAHTVGTKKQEMTAQHQEKIALLTSTTEKTTHATLVALQKEHEGAIETIKKDLQVKMSMALNKQALEMREQHDQALELHTLRAANASNATRASVKEKHHLETKQALEKLTLALNETHSKEMAATMEKQKNKTSSIIQQHQRDLQEQKEAFEFSHAQESALLLKTKEQDMNQQHEHAMKQLHKKETETSNATLALTLASLKKEHSVQMNKSMKAQEVSLAKSHVELLQNNLAKKQQEMDRIQQEKIAQLQQEHQHILLQQEATLKNKLTKHQQDMERTQQDNIDQLQQENQAILQQQMTEMKQQEKQLQQVQKGALEEAERFKQETQQQRIQVQQSCEEQQNKAMEQLHQEHIMHSNRLKVKHVVQCKEIKCKSKTLQRLIKFRTHQHTRRKSLAFLLLRHRQHLKLMALHKWKTVVVAEAYHFHNKVTTLANICLSGKERHLQYASITMAWGKWRAGTKRTQQEERSKQMKIKNMISLIARQRSLIRDKMFNKWRMLITISKQADDFELELESRIVTTTSKEFPWSMWSRVSESLNLMLPSCNPVSGCAFVGKVEQTSDKENTTDAFDVAALAGIVDVRSKRYGSDYTPIDSECTCYTCQRYTRSYLHHLFHADRTSCQHMIALHNLHHTCRVLARLSAEDEQLADKIRRHFPLVVEPPDLSTRIMHPPIFGGGEMKSIEFNEWQYQSSSSQHLPLVTPDSTPTGGSYSHSHSSQRRRRY